MAATTLLCVFSTLAFCLCGRLLIAIMPVSRAEALQSMSWLQSTYRVSGRARRVRQAYLVFAVGIMLIVSGVGVVQSYLELFQRLS